jgi:hypothetical protein
LTDGFSSLILDEVELVTPIQYVDFGDIEPVYYDYEEYSDEDGEISREDGEESASKRDFWDDDVPF